MLAAEPLTLRDCTLFRQTLAAKPPAVAHLGVLLCLVTVSTALVWAALTPVDLVVRATGRVRPLALPTEVFSSLGEHLDGRIVEVRVREGATVRRGELLLRLDTRRLEHETASSRRRLQATEAERAQLVQLVELQKSQYNVASTKAMAELRRAMDDVKRARDAQASRVRAAQSELSRAREEFARSQKLVADHVISRQELVERRSTLRQTEERLKQAELPLDEGQPAVLRQSLALVEREFRVRSAELETRLIAKQQEIDSTVRWLAELDRQAGLAVLRSPVDGIVTKGQFHVGDVVPLGKAVFEIAPHGGYCFEANVASQDMGLVTEGMKARVKLDAYDYQLYGSLSGPVRFIAPDSGRGQTEGVPSSASAGYQVRIGLPGDRIGKGEFQGNLKLGLSGQVEIITDRRTVLSILLRRIRSSVSLG